MKRISGRDVALMCLPILIPVAVLSWMKMTARPPHNGIRVVTARSGVPTPAAVEQGADIGAAITFNEMPDDNTGLTWTTGLRVVAGEHLLWKDGDDVERKVGIGARSTIGGIYQWDGTFDLDTVPASWGQVALLWDVKLVHTRTRWWRDYDEISRRNGRVVLRRADEKLAAPEVSRDLRLKLLRVEIKAPTTTGSGTTLSYPIHFYFERDNVAQKLAADYDARITCNYRIRPNIEPDNPNIVGFMSFASTNGSDETTRFYQKGEHAAARAARRYPEVTHTIEVDKARPLEGENFIDWQIVHGDFWPAQFTMRFSDARGRVLVGTSTPKLAPAVAPKSGERKFMPF